MLPAARPSCSSGPPLAAPASPRPLPVQTFNGKDLKTGNWVNKLLGTNSTLVAMAGSVLPLFSAMPLRDDVNFFVLFTPVGFMFPIQGKDGAPPTKTETAKGILSKARASARPPGRLHACRAGGAAGVGPPLPPA